MLRYLLLMAVVDGFFIQESLFNRFGVIRHSSASPPASPPRDPVLVDLGGSSKDVRFVTKDQAKLVLEIWTTNKEWESRESKFMMNVLERDNTNDLFVGYCPEYQNKHTIRYLFHMRVAFGENPYLSVINGVSCPFDSSDLSSYQFKERLAEVVPILPISFEKLLQNPKFSLTWSLEKLEKKYQDRLDEDEDDEGDYI